MITSVTFVMAVPLPESGKRIDRFETREGWVIEPTPSPGVLSLRRVASQNVPEVPAFEVWGVGYIVREERDNGSDSTGGPDGPAATGEVPATEGESERGASVAPAGTLAVPGGDRGDAQGEPAAAEVLLSGSHGPFGGGTPAAAQRAEDDASTAPPRLRKGRRS